MLLEDDKAAGRLLMVHVNGKFYTWKPPGFRKSLVPVGAAAAPAGAQLCDAAVFTKLLRTHCQSHELPFSMEGLVTCNPHILRRCRAKMLLVWVPDKAVASLATR